MSSVDAVVSKCIMSVVVSSLDRHTTNWRDEDKKLVVDELTESADKT